jgi:hypothetical protein
MSDINTANNAGEGRGLGTAVMIGVIVLCVVACAITFLLPADSLVVDLVYQGF